MRLGRINFACDNAGTISGAVFTGLETIGLIAGLAGTAVSAAGTIAGGAAQKSAADYQAQQLKMKAAESLAASQREAADRQKQADLVMSRQQAGAASSGLGALDPTILQLQGDTFAQGRLNRDMTLYQGKSQRAGLLDQAKATIASGKAAQTGSILGATGTILGGVSSFGTKYANISRPEGAKPAVSPMDEDDDPQYDPYGNRRA